ncbi:Cysteine-rich membrane protein 2 [Spironucleus salmonicida]|uniref:Cysteine-rich membrane protein 2 n=1 Tax=Spironucleus salmonicida TaxID=348837 RepID=V6LIT3_9EUKA|nr:Cysteine-rich membrane protein 2 [Spironucleus salmonicida]|eukprot:EST44515.1 Cysteine-rich membrane protein 2 [Spironucleus salmonicida]
MTEHSDHKDQRSFQSMNQGNNTKDNTKQNTVQAAADPDNCYSYYSEAPSECAECIRGYFLKDKNCVKCTDPCLTCMNAINCESCVRTHEMKNDKCIEKQGWFNECDQQNSCKLGTYCQKTKSGNRCIGCISPCLTCKNQNQCLSCADTHEMNTDQSCTLKCKSKKLDNACISNRQVICGSPEQKTACVCGYYNKNCLTCQQYIPVVPEPGICTDKLCKCDPNAIEICTGCIGMDYYLQKNKCVAVIGPYSCKTCLPGYQLNNGSCNFCLDGYQNIGDFCFLNQVEEDEEQIVPNNISVGIITGIVITIIIVVTGVAATITYQIIRKLKK